MTSRPGDRRRRLPAEEKAGRRDGNGEEERSAGRLVEAALSAGKRQNPGGRRARRGSACRNGGLLLAEVLAQLLQFLLDAVQPLVHIGLVGIGPPRSFTAATARGAEAAGAATGEAATGTAERHRAAAEPAAGAAAVVPPV